MEVVGIHHIAIQTSDFKKSLNFYVDILGFKLLENKIFKKRKFAWIETNGIKIELYSKRNDEELIKWDDKFCGPVHLAFVVKDLNEFVNDILSKGYKLHPSHPQIFTPPVVGAKPIAYLYGPDGEEIEFRE